MMYLVAFALMALPPNMRQPSVVTPIDRPALVEAMRAGHVAEFGREPSKSRLGMGMAVVLHEGALRHSVCRNLGNIGAGNGQAYCRTGPSRYRAFATFGASSHAFWHHFATRCRGGIDAVRRGQPNRNRRSDEKVRLLWCTRRYVQHWVGWPVPARRIAHAY